MYPLLVILHTFGNQTCLIQFYVFKLLVITLLVFKHVIFKHVILKLLVFKLLVFKFTTFKLLVYKLLVFKLLIFNFPVYSCVSVPRRRAELTWTHCVNFTNILSTAFTRAVPKAQKAD